MSFSPLRPQEISFRQRLQWNAYGLPFAGAIHGYFFRQADWYFFSCVTTSAAGCLLWVFWFAFVKKRPKSQLFFQVLIIIVVCIKFYWSKPHLVCSAVMVA